MSGFTPDFATAEVRPSPNHGERRDDRTPDMLILHYTGMPSAEAALEWLDRELRVVRRFGARINRNGAWKLEASPSNSHRRSLQHSAVSRNLNGDSIRGVGPDLLIVSYGADTFADDPISHFRLTCEDYGAMGHRIASLGLPTLVVMGGGYAVDALGANVGAFLGGMKSLPA